MLPNDTALINDMNHKLAQIPGCADRACLVSWDDVKRAADPTTGFVSSYGPNITDCTLCDAETNTPLYTIRGPNWDEQLGRIESDTFAIVDQINDAPTGNMYLRTLDDKLKELGFALSDNKPEQISVRIQTIVVPLHGKTTRQIIQRAHSYQCNDDNHPPNMLLVGNGMGTFVDQNRCGTSHVPLRRMHENGIEHAHALEVEATRHTAAAQAMVDTIEERTNAIQRGKTGSTIIGLPSLGERSNILFFVQIPISKHPCPDVSSLRNLNYSESNNLSSYNNIPVFASLLASDELPVYKSLSASGEDDGPVYRGGVGRTKTQLPVTSAARASIGIDLGPWSGLKVVKPMRDPSLPITVTIALYVTHDNTTGTGFVDATVLQDIVAMHVKLYKSCPGGTVHLSDTTLEPMDDKTMKDINQNVSTHPPMFPNAVVSNYDVFPSS